MLCGLLFFKFYVNSSQIPQSTEAKQDLTTSSWPTTARRRMQVLLHAWKENRSQQTSVVISHTVLHCLFQCHTQHVQLILNKSELNTSLYYQFMWENLLVQQSHHQATQPPATLWRSHDNNFARQISPLCDITMWHVPHAYKTRPLTILSVTNEQWMQQQPWTYSREQPTLLAKPLLWWRKRSASY